MRTYVMSDLHGRYDAYVKMLKKIQFSDNDRLYIIGDILDRGPNPVRIVLDLMNRPNVVCFTGNHEYMALQCLDLFMNESTEEGPKEIGLDRLEKILNWQMNGSATTIREFGRLSTRIQKKVVEFLSGFGLYREVTVNGEVYLLVHAGLGNFSPDKPLEEYEIEELVWERPDYSIEYYPDKYVITGHTPTMMIRENPRPGYIYRKNHHIAIDCGAVFGGRLACLCLETQEEFYVECERQNR